MAEYLIKEESLRALADLVRDKTGATGELTMQEIMEQIQPLAVVSGVTAEAGDVLAGKTIVDADGNTVDGTLTMPPDGDIDLSGVTANASDVLKGKTFIDADGNTVEGAIDCRSFGDGDVYYDLMEGGPSKSIIYKGYYDGNGYVSAYTQNKTVTPKKSYQTVRGDSIGGSYYRYFLLSEVKVNPIPNEYQDITVVTATADKVAKGSVFVDADGNVVEGTMNADPEYSYVTASENDVLKGKKFVDSLGDVVDGAMEDNGGWTDQLNSNSNKVMVPAGYHDGTGYVDVKYIDKVFTPTKTKQTYGPPNDESMLRSVEVNPIPDEYHDVSSVNATAEDVLLGKMFVDAAGNLLEGTLLAPGTAAVTIENTATIKFNFAAYVDNEWETFTLYPPGIPTMTSSINLNVKVGSTIVGYVAYDGGSSAPSRTFYRVSGANMETMWIDAGSSSAVAGSGTRWVCLALIIPTESEVTIETYY